MVNKEPMTQSRTWIVRSDWFTILIG